LIYLEMKEINLSQVLVDCRQQCSIEPLSYYPRSNERLNN
jgi:hypothetical protein